MRLQARRKFDQGKNRRQDRGGLLRGMRAEAAGSARLGNGRSKELEKEGKSKANRKERQGAKDARKS
jgi:hypothetical protein